MTRCLIGGLDIETTGLSQVDGHRMVEIALVIYDLDTQAQIGKYETRLNPERGIDPKAEAVHGISYDSLITSPRWEAVAPKLAILISKCRYIVAHNGIGFDMPFIYGEFVRVGEMLPSVRVVDTMLQARWATPDGAVPNLGALCFASGVEYDKSKAHGASYDTECMMACFFKHLPTGFFTMPTEPFQYVPMAKKAKK